MGQGLSHLATVLPLGFLLAAGYAVTQYVQSPQPALPALPSPATLRTHLESIAQEGADSHALPTNGPHRVALYFGTSPSQAGYLAGVSPASPMTSAQSLISRVLNGGNEAFFRPGDAGSTVSTYLFNGSIATCSPQSLELLISNKAVARIPILPNHTKADKEIFDHTYHGVADVVGALAHARANSADWDACILATGSLQNDYGAADPDTLHKLLLGWPYPWELVALSTDFHGRDYSLVAKASKEYHGQRPFYLFVTAKSTVELDGFNDNFLAPYFSSDATPWHVYTPKPRPHCIAELSEVTADDAAHHWEGLHYKDLTTPFQDGTPWLVLRTAEVPPGQALQAAVTFGLRPGSGPLAFKEVHYHVSGVYNIPSLSTPSSSGSPDTDPPPSGSPAMDSPETWRVAQPATLEVAPDSPDVSPGDGAPSRLSQSLILHVPPPPPTVSRTAYHVVASASAEELPPWVNDWSTDDDRFGGDAAVLGKTYGLARVLRNLSQEYAVGDFWIEIDPNP